MADATSKQSLGHNVIITVLGMVAAAGSYGGYTVYKDSADTNQRPLL
jgi:hypothetical protein